MDYSDIINVTLPSGGITEEFIKQIYNSTVCCLSEKDKRLVAGAFAHALGYGGIMTVHKATGISRVTNTKGVREIESMHNYLANKTCPLDISSADLLFLTGTRKRRAGGGRKKAVSEDERIKKFIEEILFDCTYGDPMSRKRWYTCSVSKIKRELENQFIFVSETVIRKAINDLGYSRQENKKMLQLGDPHPDRDKQFKNISRYTKEFLASGNPVISVDTKKKEPLGTFANKGKEYRLVNDPRKAYDHDFVSKSGYGIPYGIYDIALNKGFVNLGCDHDTAQFAANSIRNWWNNCGKYNYPNASRLLVLCDGGGSNSSRSRVWKHEIWKLSRYLDLSIHVSHFPPGNSKHNKIEHRLFSIISMNWAGQALETLDIMKNYICSTTTSTGLTVMCEIDYNKYSTGIRLTKEEIQETEIKRKESLPLWNYYFQKQK